MVSPSLKIVIDGNIGSGKSTQLKLLESKGFSVRCEPIHEWPLKLFYEDQTRWAFLLQMNVLKSFVELGDNVTPTVWERSPESSKYVFWKMLRDRGIGSDEEDLVYSFFYEKNTWKPDVHIYIRTSPEKCHERICRRFQDGDTSIDLEYLKLVHTYYEGYISDNVIVIDGEDSPENIHKVIMSHICK